MNGCPCLLWSREPCVVPPSIWEKLVRLCACPDCAARIEAHGRTGSWRLEKDGPPQLFESTRSVDDIGTYFNLMPPKP
jgi:hypothetical protein